MSELKRCPFCGGEARLQKPYRKRGWYVICKNTNCGCRTPFYQHLYTSEEDLRTIATMVWNTRKPMERITERLEEEKKFYNSASYTDQAIRQGVMIAIEIVREEGGMNE